MDEAIEVALAEVQELVEQAIAQAEEAAARTVGSYQEEQKQREALGWARVLLTQAAKAVTDIPLATPPDHHWHLNYLGEEDRSGGFFYPKWWYPTLKSAQDKMRLERYERDELRQPVKRTRRGKRHPRIDRAKTNG